MSMDSVSITYTGATPGNDSNTYVLFATAPPSAGSTNFAFPGAKYCAMNKLKRYVLQLVNSQAGTLNVYVSKTRAGDAANNPTTTTPAWVQVSTAAIVASTTAAPNVLDILIEHYDDFKVEWVNGGAPQATWLVQQALSGERVKSS